MIRARIIVALLALLGASGAVALPQDRGYFQFVRDTWGVEEGIPQVSVHAIAQDRAGYLWAATESGLGRLDGVRFESFRRDRYPALGTNLILALHVDRGGRLWIGTGRGAVVYADGEFEPVLGPDGELGATETIAEDDQGNVYLGGDHAFRKRHGPSRAVPVTGLDTKVRSLAWHAGEVWATTGGALYRIAHDAAQRVELPPVPTINRLVSLDAERLLLVTDAGLHAFGRGRVEHFAPRDPRDPARRVGELAYTDAIVDDSGSIWAGAHAALVRFDGAGRLLDAVYADALEGLNDPISFFEDRENNLWIGNRLTGVTRLWAGRAQLFGTADGLRDPIVWSMLPLGENDILVGSIRGMSRFDGRHFRDAVPASALASGDAYSLTLAPDGSIWVGGERGLTIVRLDAVGAARRLEPFAQAKVFNVLFDPDGSAWIATSQGLFHHRDGRVERAGAEDDVADAVALRRDRRGTLWVGTRRGLFALVDGRFQRHADAKLAKTFVTVLAESAAGDLLAGSLDEGIFVLDVAAAGFPVRRHVALESVPVNGIVDAGDGTLWITTLQGVIRARFDALDALATHVDEHYVVSDLGDRPGSQRARCCNGLSDGHAVRIAGALYVATSNGVLKLPLDQAVRNPVPPIAQVQSVRQHAQTRAIGNGPVELEGDDRDLEISYTALSFQDPRNLRFRYRMVGLSDAWIDAGQRRTAYFTGLAGGNYRFQVMAANSAGTPSDAPAEAAILVPLRWYERPALRVALALAALGAVALSFWLLLREQRRRSRALEAIVARRTAELQDANTQLELGQHDLAVLGEVGREINATLDRDAVLRILDGRVHALLDAPVFAVYLAEAAGGALVSALDPGERVEIDDPTHTIARCVRERREILEEREGGDATETRTRLFAPLTIGERVIGAMTVQSRHAAAYGERERKIFGTLSAYAAIALDNASAYERLAATDAALSRALREQQVIFDYASGAIQFTRGRTIVRCNRGMEELLGYGPGELDGQPTRVFYASDAAWEAFGRRNYPLLAGGGVAQGETEFVRRDGGRSHVLYSGKAIDPADVSQGVVWVAQDISARKQHEQQLLDGKRQVEHALEQMGRTQRQVSLLSELTGFLQACPGEADAYACLDGYGPRLFPGSAGALYVFDDANDELIERARWGDGASATGFAATQCWALRRGQPYRIEQPAGVLCCQHVAARGGEHRPYDCVPVGAQGRTFGLLFVEHRGSVAGEPLDVPQGLVVAMAEQTGLSLANIRLREALVRRRATA